MGNSATKEELKTVATTAGVSEEELLECPVCFMNMLDRQPRALSCLHTFCDQCLRSIKDKNYPLSNSIPCPTCRQFTTLPPGGISGLPSNFMLKEFGEKLKDMIGNQKQSCEKCDGEGKTVAGSRVCLDCGFYLCLQCTEDHIRHAAFAAHLITDHIESAYCGRHKRFVKFYCNTCNITVCALCVSDAKHVTHSETIKPIAESTVNCAAEIAQYRQRVQETLHLLNDKVQSMESQVEAVKFSIRDGGEHVKQQVDSSVNQLLAKLDKLCGPLDQKTEEMSVKQVELMQVIEELSCREKLDIRTLISLKNKARIAITSGQELGKSETDLARFVPANDIINVGSLLHPGEPEVTVEQQEDMVQVYVENMSSDSDDDTLKEMFRDYQSTVHVKVVKVLSRIMGIVVLKDKKEAIQAVKDLNGKTISNNVIHVGHIQPVPHIQAAAGPVNEETDDKEEDEEFVPKNNNLYIKNIDHRVDDERLRLEFEVYGEIISAKVMYDSKGNHKGFGFVCFETEEEAAEAMAKMNGKKILSKKLYVALHQSKEKRKALLAKQKGGRQSQTMEDAGTSKSPPPPVAAAYPPPMMAHPQHYVGVPHAYGQPMLIRSGVPQFAARPPGIPRGRSGFAVPNPSSSDVNTPSSSCGREEAGQTQAAQSKTGRRPRSATPNRKTGGSQGNKGAAGQPKHKPRKGSESSEEVRQIAEGLRPQIQQYHPKLADDIINVLVKRDKEDLLQMLLSRNKLMASVDLIVATLKER